MISREPHRLFAFLWSIWGILTIYLFALGPTTDWWVFWFSYFLVVEITGVAWNSGLRDTLSEICTWVIRHLAGYGPRRFARGWNAAMLAFCFVVARLGVYPLGDRFDALIISVLVTIWLYDHWVSPDVFG